MLLSPQVLPSSPISGFGDCDYEIAFCCANRPPIDDYPSLQGLRPLAPGELDHIVANTSNHWRKLFNVFAKFRFELNGESGLGYSSWQAYRDTCLLRGGSQEALLFSDPRDFSAAVSGGDAIHIIAGKTYANEFPIPDLHWLDAHFALSIDSRIIVSPYLDYRQLSNERISRLVSIVRALRAGDAEKLMRGETE